MSPTSVRAPAPLVRAPREADSVPLLPQDLLERSKKRLGNAALVYGSCYVLALGAAEYNYHVLGRMPWDGWNKGYSVAAIFVVVSAIMFRASRSRLPSARVLQAGLAFEVVGAFGIALGTVADTVWPVPFRNVGIPWTCAWILFFPFVVPARPAAAAFAAYGSALTGPAALTIWQILNGLPFPSAQVFAWLAIPPLICAGVATFGSQMVHALGVRLGREQALGAYLLEERIGSGGFGEIWRASHRALATPAAVKFVRRERLQGPDAGATLASFFEEAHATAALTSPHTVRLYHYGVHDDGTVYFVMELLDGMNLDALVTRHGSLPPERAAHFLAQVCRSLSEAHATGLVHRDIKPSNLFVCRQGMERDFLKVLDFGLVGRSAGVHDPDDRLDQTTSLELVGTPATIPPERVSGRSATALSDIYSLGCVGYWLLTGKPVFEGTPREVLLAHVRETPIRPSDRAGAGTHPGLESVVMRCLEKDPTRRPQGAAALLEELLAIPFEVPWTEARAAEWWRERET